MKLFRFSPLFFLLFSACTASRKIKADPVSPISQMKFINELIVPGGTQFMGTVLGGLSSIDYDPAKGLYYMICDDPSAQSPARFYTARIVITGKGIDSVVFVNVTTIKNAAGVPYADIRKDRTHSLDAESMRYNPRANEFIIGSEGQRVHEPTKWLLEDPAVVVQHYDGSYKDSFALPANMRIQEAEKGPRHNSVFEGMTFSDNYRYVYVNTESPIYEDGYAAGTGDSTAWLRISKFNTRTKKLAAQYAYQVDPVPYPANPPGAFKINGVTDLLYLGNKKFLVLERAYSTGRGPSDVRVFIADAKNARDISKVDSLEKNPPQHPFTKKLLFNFESLGIYIDNVEGVTFGPVLPNGHQTLIFVTDNDFLLTRKMQFFLFELIP